MAYCKNCGAYIPDGETSCMACGSSQADEPAFSGSYAAQAASASSRTDELRDTLAEKQREQQEKAREWAQQAYAEFKEGQAHTTSAHTGGTPTASKPASSGISSVSKSKIFAALSYVSFFCFLPFFCAKDDEYAKFHAKQGILLFAMSIIIDALSNLNLIATALNIFRLYLIYKGVRNALEGKKEELPYIGKYASKF